MSVPALATPRIVRLTPDAVLPRYETAGSVGFDFAASSRVVIAAGEIALIPTGLVIETPEGYALIIASRSSTPRKKGLMQPHGIGVIDQDYCGPEDEIRIQVKNMTEGEVVVEKGEKIAQGMFVRVDRLAFNEVEVIERATRGGFGSTDGK